MTEFTAARSTLRVSLPDALTGLANTVCLEVSGAPDVLPLDPHTILPVDPDADRRIKNVADNIPFSSGDLITGLINLGPNPDTLRLQNCPPIESVALTQDEFRYARNQLGMLSDGLFAVPEDSGNIRMLPQGPITGLGTGPNGEILTDMDFSPRRRPENIHTHRLPAHFPETDEPTTYAWEDVTPPTIRWVALHNGRVSARVRDPLTTAVERVLNSRSDTVAVNDAPIPITPMERGTYAYPDTMEFLRKWNRRYAAILGKSHEIHCRDTFGLIFNREASELQGFEHIGKLIGDMTLRMYGTTTLPMVDRIHLMSVLCGLAGMAADHPDNNLALVGGFWNRLIGKDPRFIELAKRKGYNPNALGELMNWATSGEQYFENARRLIESGQLPIQIIGK